nr:MAG TPA: repressor domain protein [Caudoviricetes sp.]
MIAQTMTCGYTDPAREKKRAGLGSSLILGAHRLNLVLCGFFVRKSPVMGGVCGTPSGVPFPRTRSANLQALAHPAWQLGMQVPKTCSRRHTMSNVSLCASAPVEFQFQSNTVRTVAIDGEVWFCATDVCSVLGYVNSRDAVSKHCKTKGVAKRDTLTEKGNQELTYINESNLYRLIIRSKKPEAEKFETWVMEEVLPAIRKTGAYIHAPAMRPALTTAQKRALKQKIWQMAPNWITQSGEQWIYNHLRVAFQVARFDDIPSDCFDAAMALLESKQKAISQYGELFYEMRTWFEREVLGASTPWTPHIRKLFFAKLGRQVILPPKVDWLALADEMKARKGGLK